jgi:hypothetical protein
VAIVDGELHIRLARRKHRPRGALLRRRCCCGKSPFTGETDSRFVPHIAICPVCCFKTQMELGQYREGERLFQFSSSQFLAQFKKRSSFANCALLRTKSWRSGMATTLVAGGAALGTVLDWGQWKSKAFLDYVSKDSLDTQAFISSVVANEESDAEELLEQSYVDQAALQQLW